MVLCPKRFLVAAAALTVAPTLVEALPPADGKDGGKDIPAVDPADTPEVQAQAAACAKVFNDAGGKEVVKPDEVVVLWKKGINPGSDEAFSKKYLAKLGLGIDDVSKMLKIVKKLQEDPKSGTCKVPPGVGPSAATSTSVSLLAAVGTGLFVLFF